MITYNFNLTKEWNRQAFLWRKSNLVDKKDRIILEERDWRDGKNTSESYLKTLDRIYR